VICACGNTWTTGSTRPEIRTDVCSACHPFYTGEQRIVDTEGQVDRFLKRLRAREERATVQQVVEEAQTSPAMPVTELELGTRYENALAEAGITTVAGIISVLEEGGELSDIKGIGAKTAIDIKKALRSRGFQLPEDE
jgi:large subunit ribosomal protein L31